MPWGGRPRVWATRWDPRGAGVGSPRGRWAWGAVARAGRLREGHLEIAGERIAIAYFRAAYGPEDFQSEDAFRGRALIEAASAIAVPDLYTQLAGAKKVQQVLTRRPVLGRFPAGRGAGG